MSFAYKRSITIDHTKCGSSNSSNFPVLVSFTDATFKVVGSGGHVQNSNGYDICFYSDSALTSALFWEIERYISTTGELIAWVKAPTVSSSVDTVIYVGYGDSGISTFQSTATSTWDTNYNGVWHFPDGTTLGLLDSTSNAANGTNVNTATATTGKNGGGIATSGSKYANFGSAGNYTTENFTLEMWLNTTDGNGVLVCKGVNAIGGYYMDLGGGILRTIINHSGSTDPIFTYVTVTTNVWHHIVFVRNGTDGKFYYDGAGLTTYSPSITNPTSSADPLVIAQYYSNIGNTPVTGSIDEFRISNVARSADWILTNYNSQNSPSTFFTLGSETSNSATSFYRLGLLGVG